MELHQHAVVKILSHLGQVWVYASHKPELLTTSMMVSVRNVAPLGMKKYPLPLIAFKIFSCQRRIMGVLYQFLWFFGGSFGHFYALTEFSMHFMCIIQIWTTCTCSSAYKLVEKSNMCPWVHARNGNEFQTPGHCWLPAKHWDILVFKF